MPSYAEVFEQGASEFESNFKDCEHMRAMKQTCLRLRKVEKLVSLRPCILTGACVCVFKQHAT